MAIIKIPGQEITLAGEKMVLAPLTAGPLRQLLPLFDKIHELSIAEQLDVAVDCAYHSLRRNYPDITRERVEDELVDIANMGAVIAAATNASGLLPAPDAKEVVAKPRKK